MTAALKVALGLMAVTAPGNVIEEIVSSGRCVSLAETPDMRVERMPAIAPGQAPLFSFRLYEGQSRQRFANSDLMMDDAGH